MKKIPKIIFVLCIMTMVLFAAPAEEVCAGGEAEHGIKQAMDSQIAPVNGQGKTIDGKSAVLITKNGRAMLPIRFIKESNRFEVNWNDLGENMTLTQTESDEPTASGTWIETTDTYERWELHVDNNGDDIYGELYIPRLKANSYPTVILSHGLGGTSEGGQRYAVLLAKMGIATYCFDYRGVSANSRSQGIRTTEMSILTAESDLEAVLAAARNWNIVDRDNVFLMGYSMGGLTSSMVAPKYMNEIRAEILFYPAFVIKDFASQLKASASEIPETVEFHGVLLGKKYIEDALDYDLYAQAEKFTKNVLLLHGTKDEMVDISYSEKLRSRLDSVEYRVIEGGAHSFQGEHFAEAMGYVTAFLKKEIKR